MENKLGKYSLGIGDRFAQQGIYQMEAICKSLELGTEIIPVWNKSFREHQTVGSHPESVRKEADESVLESGWNLPYFVDADHIRMDTVEEFISTSDFYTIDVADQIGKLPPPHEIDDFIDKHRSFIGDLNIPGVDRPLIVTKDLLVQTVNKFYLAIRQAGRIYEKIKALKGDDNFITEISMDEVEEPQSPIELFFIVLLVAENGIPLNTIAPKFTGKFNKGVDYEGDIDRFGNEFETGLLVLKSAIEVFDLPSGLKFSIHTGSDKFSLYPVISRIIKKHNSGLHLKTAGTTWLEELIGLAESGAQGLAISKSIYFEAILRYDELIGPYGSVLNIDRSKLPSGNEIRSWDGNKFSNSIKHDKSNSDYNPHLRQLLHTAYKIAAQKGDDFLKEVKNNREIIGMNVRSNLLERHIKPLFNS